MSEIYQLSLFELVNKIKSKEISCEEATKSYVERSSKSKKIKLLR
jgi:aspartyl-tRNA(Asn)/glutamyl-tRNA(Gln) amidotransferase subunit A